MGQTDKQQTILIVPLCLLMTEIYLFILYILYTFLEFFRLKRAQRTMKNTR